MTVEINRFLNLLRGAIIGLLVAIPASFGYIGISTGIKPMLFAAFGTQVLGGIALTIWIGILQKRIQTKNCQPAGGAYGSPEAGSPPAHP